MLEKVCSSSKIHQMASNPASNTKLVFLFNLMCPSVVAEKLLMPSGPEGQQFASEEGHAMAVVVSDKRETEATVSTSMTQINPIRISCSGYEL